MRYLLFIWFTVGIIWELSAIVNMTLGGEKMEKDEKLPFIVGSMFTIFAGPIVIPYSIWLLKQDK